MRCKMLLVVFLASVGPFVAAQESAENTVPTEELQDLRGRMVDLESPLPDARKIRSLTGLMRRGRMLVRRHADATNLYMVRHLMLEAQRKLMMLGEPIAREELVELARDILAAEPPLEWRFSPDLLLAQMQAMQHAGQPKEVASVLDSFVKPYLAEEDDSAQKRELATQALMQASQIARRLGADKASEKFLDMLADSYSWEPGVVNFLLAQGREINYRDRPFFGTVELLDGGTLTVPRQTMGRTVALWFWSAQQPRSIAMIPEIKEFLAKAENRGLVFLAVNVDPQEDMLRDAIAEHELEDWAHVFSGKGTDDPLLTHYKIRAIPTLWVVDCTGVVRRTHQDDGTGFRWDRAQHDLVQVLLRGLRKSLRQLDLRSGIFLDDLVLREALAVADQPGAIPEEALRRLELILFRRRINPHPEERAEQVRLLLDELRRLTAEHPEAPNAFALRALEMMAAQYLAIRRDDRALRSRAVELAGLFAQAEDTLPIIRQLADYVLMRHELVSAEPDPTLTEQVLARYIKRYPKEPEYWPALWLRYITAAEFSDMGVFGNLWRSLRAGTRTFEHRAAGMARIMLPRAYTPHVLHAEVEKFDGKPLRLPDDLLGNVVVVHFWTMDAPPGSPWFQPILEREDCTYVQTKPRPDHDFTLVGVNLDADREAARRYAQEHMPGWVHAYIGDDPDHPVLREYDIQALPNSWLLLANGEIQNHDRQMSFTGSEPYDAAANDLRLMFTWNWHKRPDRCLNAARQTQHALRLVELQFATELEMPFLHERTREEMIGHLRRYYEPAPGLFRRRLDALNTEFHEHLDQLSRGEEGAWQPERKLEAAQEALAEHRRTMAAGRGLVEAESKIKRLLDAEVDTSALHDVMQEAEALDPPDDFPEPEAR